MAKTKNGIYYPDDYNSIADVPNDIKKIAKSVDAIVENIEKEQKKQDDKITGSEDKAKNAEAEIQALKSENTLLKSQIPSATVVGETVHLEDSSNMQCQIMPLGASIQEGTPSIDSETPIESVGDNINYLPTDESEWEQGTISDGVVQASTTRIRTKNYCLINVLEQTISLLSGQNYVYGNIHYYNSDKTYINNQYILSGSIDTNFTKLTFTPPEGATYFKVVIKKIDDSTILASEISTIKPKLEKGTKATPYSPYGQGSIEITIGEGTASKAKALYIQQPLRSIGDVKDRFVKVDEVWYEQHDITRIESYNGENITTSYISTTGELSIGATVDYVSEVHLLIPCTPEQVEVLESFNTYKNVTNISSDSIGELEVFYYKDLETLLGGA